MSEGISWGARWRIPFEGWVLAGGSILLGMLLSVIWSGFGVISWIAAIICLIATRDEQRTIRRVPDEALSPVDGIISAIDEATPPAELGLGHEAMMRFRIISPVWSATGVRAPIGGDIVNVVRRAGQSYSPVSDTDAPETSLVFIRIEGAQSAGVRIGSTQFELTLTPQVTPGTVRESAELIATRRFGGMCDVYLPRQGTSRRIVGQKVIAGESVLMQIAKPAEAE